MTRPQQKLGNTGKSIKTKKMDTLGYKCSRVKNYEPTVFGGVQRVNGPIITVVTQRVLKNVLAVSDE